MNVVYTKHALIKMQHRDISEKYVKMVIENAESITTEGSKFYAYKKFTKLYLKVVFKKLNNTIVIITVHWTEKIK